MKEGEKSAGVVVSIFIDLPPLETFEVFTSEVGLWWQSLPQNTFRVGRKGVMRFESGVGGALLETYPGTTFAPYEVGRVSVWDPGHRLVFDFRGGNFSGNEVTQVEVRFESEEAGTRLTLEHRGWEVIPLDHPVRHGLPESTFWKMVGSFWSDLLRDARKHTQLRKEIL